jgi:VWFA-related protein
MKSQKVIFKTLMAFLIFSCLTGMQAGAGNPDDENYKIKVKVNLVTADITVIGAPATEFRAEDFIIYDNSVAQKTSNFSRDQMPLAVALLVDVSPSINEYLPSLQMAAVSALRRLKPRDQAVLFSFTDSKSRMTDLTENSSLIAEKIGKLKIRPKCNCKTNIYDAIFDAARYLQKTAPNRRRAIILISDNCHSADAKHNPNACLAELLETATSLYSIKPPGDTSSSCATSHQAIKRMAEETGSEVWDVNAPKSLSATLENAVANLRTQYTIGFNPTDLGERGSFHKLAVKFADQNRCPSCRIMARSGYYAGVSAPLSLPGETMNARRQYSSKESDQSLVQNNILIAGTAYQDLQDIAFYTSTVERKDSLGNPQIVVKLDIYPEKTNFKTENNRHACNFRTVVFYADEKGNILGSDSRKIEGLLSQDNYANALKSGISFSTTIPLKAKNQILKIVVYDEANDMAGSQIVRLQNSSYR